MDARDLISREENAEEDGHTGMLDGKSGTRVLAAWFLATAVATTITSRQAAGILSGKAGRPVDRITALRARHARWALRHMAAGFWVMVQRLVIPALGLIASVGLLPPPFSALWGSFETDLQRVRGFKAAAVASVVICVTTVELFIFHMRMKKRIC